MALESEEARLGCSTRVGIPWRADWTGSDLVKLAPARVAKFINLDVPSGKVLPRPGAWRSLLGSAESLVP
jgi:hypothetical protein